MRWNRICVLKSISCLQIAACFFYFLIWSNSENSSTKVTKPRSNKADCFEEYNVFQHVLFILGTEVFFFKGLPFSFLGTEVAKICSKVGFCLFFLSKKRFVLGTEDFLLKFKLFFF